MTEVSLARLYLLRAMYLLILVGLALMIWPLILDPPPDLEHMRGVVWSLLAAVSLLAALGIRYPIKMLPLLLFEIVWKLIWIAAIGLPRWSAGTLTPGMTDTFQNCLVGVLLVPLVIPWRFVFSQYATAKGDRWR